MDRAKNLLIFEAVEFNFHEIIIFSVINLVPHLYGNFFIPPLYFTVGIFTFFID